MWHIDKPAKTEYTYFYFNGKHIYSIVYTGLVRQCRDVNIYGLCKWTKTIGKIVHIMQ